MLTRKGGYLSPRSDCASPASLHLEQEGYAVLHGVLSAEEVNALHAELSTVYATTPADLRNARLSAEEREDFRYEMFNRSALAQRTIGHTRILEVIEPLLGEDCHIIANTCWRNPPRSKNQHGGGFWHIDAGPHIPREPGIPWDDRIAYPVFAIGAHIYLSDCGLESGPTGVIPRSHKSGQFPPVDRLMDVDLDYDGRQVEPMLAKAGDVALFVSDVWHRRLPAGPDDQGRFFLQAHYGRRDLAQRIRTTIVVNQVDQSAKDRIDSPREATLLGLHKPFFYDG